LGPNSLIGEPALDIVEAATLTAADGHGSVDAALPQSRFFPVDMALGARSLC